MAKELKNLNVKMTNLEGQEIYDERRLPITINRLIANYVAQAKSKDPIRAFIVAKKMYETEGSLTLEDADYDMVFALITAADWSNLIKARVLEAFTPEQ